ncbi:MAG: class I SAM-dependent methyltransferase, partial [Dokdonella sp.]|uniref:class I SAM-dependent methyltransferase n=1 Tax=Dokdonella sp. TaxID=2291710 RepID=UPI003265024B
KQHASGLKQLNSRGFCSTELFSSNVRFRSVDMRQIPADLIGFDFLWSSCALEHLGSLSAGTDFVKRAIECLRPGGIAVHTTELNVDSDSATLKSGRDVVYRRCDLLELASEMSALGHTVEAFDFDTGNTDADQYVDEPPYGGKFHLKLRIGNFASTSYGLIMTRGLH